MASGHRNDAGALHRHGAFGRFNDEDRDSGVSTSSQKIEDDDDITIAKRLAQGDDDEEGKASYRGAHFSSYASPSPHSSSLSPHASSLSLQTSSSSPHAPSSSPHNRMRMIPRCAAPRDRVISKYPPPFHPDATPNGRINFHVAVKKACLSHHSKVAELVFVFVEGRKRGKWG